MIGAVESIQSDFINMQNGMHVPHDLTRLLILHLRAKVMPP